MYRPRQDLSSSAIIRRGKANTKLLQNLRHSISEIVLEIFAYVGIRLIDDQTLPLQELLDVFRTVALHISLEKLPQGVAFDYLCELRRLVTSILHTDHYARPVAKEYSSLVTCANVFARALAYRAENQPLWVVPEISPEILEDSIMKVACLQPCIGARLLWLEKRKARNLEPYATEDRFQGLVFDRVILRRELSEHICKNYVDDIKWFHEYRPIGWSTFIKLVSYLTYCRNDMPAFIKQLRNRLAKRANPRTRPNYPPISVFTESYSSEAMVATDAADRRCYICYYDYGLLYSDENETEPAVRTACGHVHGLRCLEHMCNIGKTKCSICARDLFGIEHRFSQEGRVAYLDLIEAIVVASRFDEEVDAYLLEGCKEVHGEDFRKLLENLAQTVTNMATHRRKLSRAVALSLY